MYVTSIPIGQLVLLNAMSPETPFTQAPAVFMLRNICNRALNLLDMTLLSCTGKWADTYIDHQGHAGDVDNASRR